MGGKKTDATIQSEKTGNIKLQQQLHRTRLCTYFLQGDCRYGARCAYAHTSTEIESAPDFRKTRLCKAFQDGVCKNPNCDFAHGLLELRSTDTFFKQAACMWYSKGRCRNGESCRFAHGKDDIRAPPDTDDCSTNAGSDSAVSKSGKNTTSSCTGTSKASSNASSIHRSARNDRSCNGKGRSGPKTSTAEKFKSPSSSCVTEPMFVQLEQPTSDNYSMENNAAGYGISTYSSGELVNAAHSEAASLSNVGPSLDRLLIDLQRLELLQQAHQQHQQQQQQQVQQQWLQEQQQQQRASQLLQQFDMMCRAPNAPSFVGRYNSSVGVGEGMASAIVSPEPNYDIFANAIGSLTEQVGRMEQQMQNLMACNIPPTRGGAVALNRDAAVQDLCDVPPDRMLRNIQQHAHFG